MSMIPSAASYMVTLLPEVLKCKFKSQTMLEKLIKNEKQNAFKDIDADALDLYLVDIESNLTDKKSPQAPSLNDQSLLLSCILQESSVSF